jgi:hypothetical protein
MQLTITYTYTNLKDSAHPLHLSRHFLKEERRKTNKNVILTTYAIREQR